MELLLSGEYPWLRRKCAYIATSVGASKGVKINSDDLFVDVVAKAITLQDKYSDLGISIKPWLGKMVSNMAITMGNKLLKQANRNIEIIVVNEDGEEVDLMDNMANPALRGASIEEAFIANADMDQIEAAISKIKPVYAEVIRLNMVEGLQYDAVAEQLKISINTVSSRVSRGRAELRALLEDLAGDYGITGKKKEK
jgi:RNA polymerase sigma-70 factor (ECF subfamily)